MNTLTIELRRDTFKSEVIEMKRFSIPENFISTGKLQDCINSAKDGPFEGLDWQKVRGAFTVGGYKNQVSILEVPEIEEDQIIAEELIRLKCPLSKSERSDRRKRYFDNLVQTLLRKKGVKIIN